MINDALSLLFRIILLAGVQVTILNNIQFSGYINPYLYVLFILLLPIRFSKVGALLLALVIGIIIDSFTNTLGLHAAATVCMAYARPLVLKFLAPRDGYESDSVPNIKELGFKWFFAYSAILVLIHHFILFYLEVFRFSEFFTTLLRIIFSAVATLLLIFISLFLFGKSKKER